MVHKGQLLALSNLIDGLGQSCNSLVAVNFTDGQRRHHTDDVGANGGDQEVVLDAVTLHFHSVDAVFQNNTNEQAAVTDGHNVRHLSQLSSEVIADLLGVLGPLASLQLTQNSQGSGAADGVASIGGTVGAGAESSGDTVGAGDAADGHTAAIALAMETTSGLMP